MKETRSLSREDKVRMFLREPDAGGHVGWDGRHGTSGAPIIKLREREQSAAHILFEQKHGAPPAGIVKNACGVRHCLNPEHMTDEPMRTRDRMWARVERGMEAVPWETCPAAGHPWEETGRLSNDLTPYCTTCVAARSRAYKSRKGVA